MSDAAYADNGSDEGQDAGSGAVEQQAPVREPLAPEELEKRWNGAKTALSEERGKRRALEARLAELESKSSPKDEADPVEALIAGLRDDLDDPLADIETTKKALKAFVAQQAAQRQQETQTTAQSRQAQQLAQTVAEHEKDFHAENPDYYDAVKHLTETRGDELKEAGLSGAALASKVNSELKEVVEIALKQGKDPAAVIYAMSRKRGFGVDSAAKTLQTIQSGLQSGRSLSSSGGRNGDSGGVTWDQVAKLKGQARLDGMAKLRAQAKSAGTYA